MKSIARRSHVGRLGVFVRNARRLVGMRQQPAVQQLAIRAFARICPLLPWVRGLKALLAQDSCHSAGSANTGRRDAARRRAHRARSRIATCARRSRDCGSMPSRAIPSRSAIIWVLPTSTLRTPISRKWSPKRRLADPQRNAVPGRAVRAHVAAGVGAHPRGAADGRLHIGPREADAARCELVDVRRLRGGDGQRSQGSQTAAGRT